MPSRPRKRQARTYTRKQPDLQPDPATLDAAKRRVRRHPGVIGVDYGFIYKNGVRTDRVGIRYHVARKLPNDALKAEERLPKQVNGVATDVIECGYKPHRGDPFAPAAVLQPGLSIGNLPRQSDGTLGLFVRDRQDGALCVLSNWHVLCGSLEARSGDSISQPGPMFLGQNPAREIAQLRRWVTPNRQYDAAIAALGVGVQTDAGLFDSTLRVAGMVEPQVGMTVIKSGVASGVTHALVDAVGGSYQVPYDNFGIGKRWMAGIHLVPDPQFSDKDVSLPGDSGSVWVEAATGRAVALNFAGEDDLGPLNEYALAHPMPTICAILEMDVAP